MIITKHNLQLLVGVLVIYCCIETIVGASIHGVFNKDEPQNSETTLSPTQTDQTSDPTMSTTVSPTEKATRPKMRLRSSMIPRRTTTTTTEGSPSTIPE